MSDTDNNTEARQTTLPNDLHVVASAWIGGKAFEMELNLDALRTASEDSILRYLGLWSRSLAYSFLKLRSEAAEGERKAAYLAEHAGEACK